MTCGHQNRTLRLPAIRMKRMRRFRRIHLTESTLVPSRSATSLSLRRWVRSVDVAVSGVVIGLYWPMCDSSQIACRRLQTAPLNYSQYSYHEYITDHLCLPRKFKMRCDNCHTFSARHLLLRRKMWEVVRKFVD